jgi:transcriptional regulator CtsR
MYRVAQKRGGEGSRITKWIHSEKFSSKEGSIEVIVLSMAKGISSLCLREVVKRMFSGFPLLSQMMGMRSQLLITTSYAVILAAKILINL